MNAQQHNVANNPALQGQMAAAILNANKEMEAKQPETKAATKPAQQMHTILIRRDVQNRPVVFLPESYSKENNVISYWSGEKGASVQETTADYYHTSKPAEPEIVKEMTSKYAARFNAKEILVRQRLFKQGVLERDEQGQAEKVDVDSYKARLKAAIMKAIDESM